METYLHYSLANAPEQTFFDAFIDKLPYCSADIITVLKTWPDREGVTLRVREGCDHGALRRSIDCFLEKLSRGHMAISKETILDSRDRASSSHRDVHQELLDRRWLRAFAPGCVGLQGPALALFEVLDADLLQIARGESASEMRFPTLISIETLNRARYLQSFPHHVTLAPPLIGDSVLIEQFRDNVTRGESTLDSADEPDHVLSPTVCIHCYQALANRVLEPDTELRVTARGKCFRHERGRLDHRARLWDFTMRELIYVGDSKRVEKSRSSAIRECAAWLEELDLPFWVETASDPFFVDTFSSQSFFQLASKTKYEFLVEIAGNQRPVAVGSANLHNTFFGESFAIRVGDNSASTACVGFGLERIALAFLAHHGTDSDTWPERIRREVERRSGPCL